MGDRAPACDAQTHPRASETKIELFYFLATGWLGRSIRSVRKPETAERLDRGWGRSDWQSLRGVQDIPRETHSGAFPQRTRIPIGPRLRHPRSAEGARIMYHIIHATDDDVAPSLMLRAYRKSSGREGIDIA
jgi:hypothetical protein